MDLRSQGYMKRRHNCCERNPKLSDNVLVFDERTCTKVASATFSNKRKQLAIRKESTGMRAARVSHL